MMEAKSVVALFVLVLFAAPCPVVTATAAGSLDLVVRSRHRRPETTMIMEESFFILPAL
jgi:hypothetical protein